MSVRKIGRKARALARAKANERFINEAWQRRRDKELEPGKREKRRREVADFVQQNPSISTRIVERRFQMHRDTITNIREEIGFIVPKKDYNCHKTRWNDGWPKQPGETRGICACGCGGKTNRTLNGSSKTGMKPGDYFRFINGHQWLLRRRLLMPKGWRSSADRMKEREQLRKALVDTAIKLPRYTKDKVSTFEDLRNRLKKIELSGHTVVDQQVARMINIGRGCFMSGAGIPSIIHANVATKAEWLERLVSVSCSMGQAEIEFSELRKRFNEPMLTSNVAVSRLLNRQRRLNPSIPVVKFLRAKPESTTPLLPITEFYPFRAQDDLLQFILSIIPARYNSEARSDIAQDMALAVIAGDCQREDLQGGLGRFISGYWKRFSCGMGHNIVSLDAPINFASGDKASMHEILSIKDSMTEIHGGMNYETQGTYFERGEQWDGEVCAHY